MSHSVVGLRRYPVKSMGGESLDVAQFDARGLVGDRWYAVEDGAGRFASGKDTRRFRRRDAVFGFSARTGPDGGVRVRRGDQEWRIGEPGLDPRRLRANVVVRTDEAFVEEGWAHLDLGGATLRLVERAPRCRTIDLAQDGVRPHGAWLKGLAAERGLFVAVYGDVVTTGEVRRGQPVAAR